MLSVKKILVPVDYSPCSAAALDYADYIARQFKSTVLVLHVWDTPNYLPPEVMVQMPGQGTRSLSDIAQEEAAREMTKFLSAIDPKGAYTLLERVEAGDPTQVILDVAKSEHADLIIMGTHGRRGLSHLFIGSVAEKVVRRSTNPVLTIRSEGE